MMLLKKTIVRRASDIVSAHGIFLAIALAATGSRAESVTAQSLELRSRELLAGQATSGWLKLSGPVPPGGIHVDLRSSHPLVTVYSMDVPEGLTEVFVEVFSTFQQVDPFDVTITASVGTSSVETTLHVTALWATGISLSANNVIGGETVLATVTLSGPASDSADGGIWLETAHSGEWAVALCLDRSIPSTVLTAPYSFRQAKPPARS